MTATRAQWWVVIEEKMREVVNEAESRPDLDPMISRLFNVQTTGEAFEQFLGASDLPNLMPFDGEFTELNQYPTYKSRIVFPEFAGKTVKERILVDDMGYQQVLADASSFVRSRDRTKENYSARFWGNVTSANWDFMENDEGVALASASHLTPVPDISTANGFDNLGTEPFSYAALHTARYNIGQFRNSIGEQINRPEKVYGILHPDWLTWEVEQVIGTEKGFDNPDMNKNPAFADLKGNGRFKSIPYSRLDAYSTEDWGLLDLEGMMRNFAFFNRIDGEYSPHVDRETLNVIQTYYCRFGFGYKADGWRDIYWNNVA